MTAVEQANYPEHDKLSAISNQSQVIGEFLEWANQTHGWMLAEYPMFDCERCEKFSRSGPNRYCTVCEGTGKYQSQRMFSIHGDIQDHLADFFGIDRTVLEEEKGVMLKAMRDLTKSA